ncbi:hypothetical protein BKA67DRAFT_647344 [Truncatella angustata]|uniref:Uncharacterized protein n=1 Tax=Truncatella angustata TaxID=152316 RepID=A0A9P8ZXX3_9PEZI|nr:uncharacterized protein BKA67DRAFT_647344 [Truncatella angustata]KAH6653463.1 hypothetical protein BKA67DRAFT_647344 [Truncatella angustata]
MLVILGVMKMAQLAFKRNDRRAFRDVHRGMTTTSMHDRGGEHHISLGISADMPTVSPYRPHQCLIRQRSKAMIVRHEQQRLPWTRRDSTAIDTASLSDVLTDDETISIKASTIEPPYSPIHCLVSEESNGSQSSSMSPSPIPLANEGNITKGMMKESASLRTSSRHCGPCCEYGSLPFHRHDKIAWNSLVNDNHAVSSEEKNAAMLRISLWAIRDYAMTMRRKRVDGGAAARSRDGLTLFGPHSTSSSNRSRRTVCTPPRSHTDHTSDDALYLREKDGHLGHTTIKIM